MKAQIYVEFLIVVGIGLALVSALILASYSTVASYQKNNDELLAKNSLEKIALAAEFVSFQGSPARQKIHVCFPASISGCEVLEDNRTISCGSNTGNPIMHTGTVDMDGVVPSSGCWYLILSAVDSDGGYVDISAAQ
jgi:uncharacterized protein (UPF0333 family)